DEGIGVGGPSEPYIQSARIALYEEALEQLKQRELVYPCACTRADVAAAASAPHWSDEGPVYPGTCAGRRSADIADLAGRPYAWRFRTTPELRELDDRVAGLKRCRVQAELGDFVVYKSDGTPAYQLSVVIDDHA